MLQKVVPRYSEYKKASDEISSLEKIIGEKRDEEEFLKLAEEELALLKSKKQALEKKLNELLTEKQEDVARNVIMEIRQGTGGIEAALFAQDLFRMYSNTPPRRAGR